MTTQITVGTRIKAEGAISYYGVIIPRGSRGTVTGVVLQGIEVTWDRPHDGLEDFDNVTLLDPGEVTHASWVPKGLKPASVLAGVFMLGWTLPPPMWTANADVPLKVSDVRFAKTQIKRGEALQVSMNLTQTAPCTGVVARSFTRKGPAGQLETVFQPVAPFMDKVARNGRYTFAVLVPEQLAPGHYTYRSATMLECECGHYVVETALLEFDLLEQPPPI